MSSLAETQMAGPQLRLLPTGDGGSLLTPDGRVVFWALGANWRQQCLDFARVHGVLVLYS